MTRGVYGIKCKPSGRIYVGSSKNIERRWSGHQRLLHRGTHHCKLLQKAYVEYGQESFKMEILEIIQTDDLLPHEVKWWEKYQPFTFNGHPDRSPQFKDNPSWLSSVLDDGNVLLWALGSVASILTMWDLVGGIRVTIILGFVVTLCRHYLKHRQLYGNKIVITPIVEETAPVIEPVAVEEVVDPITINAQRLIEEYGVTCLVGKGMGGPTKGEMSQFLFGQPNTGPNPAKLGRILERVPSLLEENPKTSSG